MKKISFFVKLISLTIIFTVTAIFGAIGLHMVLAWDGPGEDAPGGNVSAPLNVGGDFQYKTGELELRGGLSVMSPAGADSIFTTNASGILIDPTSDGDTNLWLTESQLAIRGSIYDIFDDTVNIGENLAVAGTSLTVNGNEVCLENGTNCPASGLQDLNSVLTEGNTSGGRSINMGADAITGTNWSLDYNGSSSKLTIDIVDPLYSIDGEKFSTYGPSITGAKEETTGKVSLSCWLGGCYSIIDFDKVEKGSDLWLFYQVTDLGEDWDDLVVLLTPEGSNDVWYKVRPERGQLIIYGKKETKVSYRLTAPRFDYKNWPNESEDDYLEGLKVEAKK